MKLKKLYLLRIQKGLTQYRIARIAKMSQAKYSSIERGDVNANPLDQRKISKALEEQGFNTKIVPHPGESGLQFRFVAKAGKPCRSQ